MSTEEYIASAINELPLTSCWATSSDPTQLHNNTTTQLDHSSAKMASNRFDPNTSFPLLRLPPELRNEVFRHALCPRVNILIERCLTGQVRSLNEIQSSLNLTVSNAALFRVSSQISAEASGILTRIKDSHLKLISGNKSIEPSHQTLLSSLRGCQFVLAGSPVIALRFLSGLSPLTLSVIHSLVITEYLLLYNRRFDRWSPPEPGKVGNRGCWENPTPSLNMTSNDPTVRQYPESTYFQRFLRVHLPNLKEVAVFVPSKPTRCYGASHDCSIARREILRMLEDGTINVMRLIYTEPLPASYNLGDCHYANRLIRPQAGRYTPRGERTRKQKSLDELKLVDKFAVVREDGNLGSGEAEAACGWFKAKAVFALRRYAPGAKASQLHQDEQ